MCGLTPRRLCAGLRTGSRRGNVPKRPQAFSTTMPFRRQRVSLTTIGMSAPSAPPHKLRERFDCLGQRMIHRNAQSIGIHHVHDSSKFTPMRRAALLHIKLPLMNHLMGQGASYGCDRLTGQERSRETNDPPCAVPFFRRHEHCVAPCGSQTGRPTPSGGHSIEFQQAAGHSGNRTGCTRARLIEARRRTGAR